MTRLQLYVSFQSFTFDAQIYFYMLEKCRNTSAPCSKSQCCTSTVQCVCLFMLCVRAVRCVKAWLGPAASQEDRRGSRWTGLDLTLPTPFYPPGPPSLLIQPARHTLQNESRAATECCAAPGGRGAVSHAISPSQRRPEDRE